MMKRKTKKKVSYVGLGIIAFMIIGIFVGMMCIPEAKPQKETMYHSYQIQAGDTIDAIVAEYSQYNENLSAKEFKREICRINQNNPDEITAGCYIVIPYTMEEMVE